MIFPTLAPMGKFTVVNADDPNEMSAVVVGTCSPTQLFKSVTPLAVFPKPDQTNCADIRLTEANRSTATIKARDRMGCFTGAIYWQRQGKSPLGPGVVT